MNAPSQHDDDRTPVSSNLASSNLASSAYLFNASFSEPLAEIRRNFVKKRAQESAPSNAPLTTPPGRFLHQESGIRFHSRSEAACATLMSRLIPGYRIVEGVSYEIPVSANKHGHMRTVDFLVAGVLVEFHPVRLWRSGRQFGDFQSREEWRKFLKEYHRCPQRDRASFKAETMQELEDRYTEKRLRAIGENPALFGKELIVATSSADFYEKVIDRFAPRPPSLRDFLGLFEKAKGEVTDVKYQGGRKAPPNRSSSRKR